MIGSHNFDPRSDVLNTESGFIIRDAEFAALLTDSIEVDMRPENSWLVAAKEQIPLFSQVSGFFATISRALPVFDIWPFRYSTSYELLPGKEPVGRNHSDFYENYEAVGNFPNVNLPTKQIQTIIISAFGGFAEPIM
jgi:phosphatidylserine/phosphatidylglycerophosphate/cardiolipin synthase-like enzyme